MTPKRLKAMRRRLGLTQEALAKRLGVTAGCVGHWESGIRGIPELAKKVLAAIDSNRPLTTL